MRLIALLAAIGVSGCVTTVSDSGLCAGMQRPVADLRGALEANTTATPEAVGEAGTDVVLGMEAGCRWTR